MKEWLPEEVLKTEGLKTVYGGVGFTNNLLHVNAEVPTPYGTVYAKAGGFLNGSGDPAGLIGFRYPYALTGTDLDGYYLGGFAGYVKSDTIGSEKYNRLGAGAELSYVWLNSTRLNAASVGIGVDQRKTKGKLTQQPKPLVLFSYTFGLGIY
jgi:hypothetical protein